jgi:phosphoribosylglycinamide formyltransferase-1
MSEGKPGAARVVLLAGPGPSTNIAYHYLSRCFPDIVVIMERPVKRRTLARRRARRLGWPTVAGQLAFIALVLPVLRYRARTRIHAILADAGLDPTPIAGATMVPSVNAPETVELLRSLAPEVVIVNGTRIISASVLEAVPSVFVNLHMGITPRFRGVHGGYWALAEGRPDLVGTTIHLVDAGIDTGRVLGQARFEPSARDSFATYPYLHLVFGLPILAQQVEALLAGGGSPTAGSAAEPGGGDGEGASSQLRWHPTLWGYLWQWARRGVR